MGNLYSQQDELLRTEKLNIKSKIFDEMLAKLDEELQIVLEGVYDGGFESGEVKLSLNVEIVRALHELPLEEGGVKRREYKRPQFEYKTNSILKRKHEDKGTYIEDREIVLDDGEFKAVPLCDPQVRFKILEGKNE